MLNQIQHEPILLLVKVLTASITTETWIIWCLIWIQTVCKYTCTCITGQVIKSVHLDKVRI